MLWKIRLPISFRKTQVEVYFRLKTAGWMNPSNAQLRLSQFFFRTSDITLYVMEWQAQYVGDEPTKTVLLNKPRLNLVKNKTQPEQQRGAVLFRKSHLMRALWNYSYQDYMTRDTPLGIHTFTTSLANDKYVVMFSLKASLIQWFYHKKRSIQNIEWLICTF